MPSPRRILWGLVTMGGALLLLATWSRAPWLTAAGAAILFAGITASSRDLGEPGRWARGTAATTALAAGGVALGSPRAPDAAVVLLLWAGVTGAVAWAAAGWRTRLAGAAEAADLAASWDLLRRRGILLAEGCVLAGLWLAAGGGGANAGSFVAFLVFSVGVIWGLHALSVLSRTVQALGGPSGTPLAVGAVVLLVAGGLTTIPFWEPTTFQRGSRSVDAAALSCQVSYDPLLGAPRGRTVELVRGGTGFSERFGPHDVSLALVATDDGGRLEEVVASRGVITSGTGLPGGVLHERHTSLGFGALEIFCQ